MILADRDAQAAKTSDQHVAPGQVESRENEAEMGVMDSSNKE